MSNFAAEAEQLLELLLQLKKTTPTAARSILNGQPQIAYALMALMVTINAVNIDVFHKTLAEFGTKSAPAASIPPSAAPAPTPAPAIPPHLLPQFHAQHIRTTSATPPVVPQPQPQPQPQFQAQVYPPAYQNGHTATSYGSQPQQNPTYPYAAHPQPAYGYPTAPPAAPIPAYGAPPPSQQATPAPAPTPSASILPETLAAIPDDQKALILRVITMTSEQVHSLPPAERQTYIQLRATLGVPT